MGELCVFFLGLFIVLLIITLLGHGIWLSVSWLIGLMFADSPAVPHLSLPRCCSRCATPLQLNGSTCDVCYWPDRQPDGDRSAEVATALDRHLLHYIGLGLIGQPVALAISNAIRMSVAKPVVSPATAPHAVTPKNDVEALNAEVVDAEIVPEMVNGNLPLPLVATPITPAPWYPVPAAMSNAAPTLDTTGHGIGVPAPKPEQPPKTDYPTGRIAQPRVAWSKVFASFLEEKNIRWGELVGGLLIVFCSAALVISFWAEIASRPILKFCVFNGVSASLFLVGLYTNQKWKIQTTSRGVLIIATLLVPLNLTAIASFGGEGSPSALSLGGEFLSLVIFAVLTLFGARLLVPGKERVLTFSVIFPSLMLLVIRHFAHAQVSAALFYEFAGLPILAYLAVSGSSIHHYQRRLEHDETSSNRLFILFGIATFAVAPPLIVLLVQGGHWLTALHLLSPLLALLTLPSLTMGVLFMRPKQSSVTTGQLAGISIGVLGAMLLVLAQGLAWPVVAILLPTALISAAVFVFLAIYARLPQAYVVSSILAMLAWLLGYHVLREHFPLWSSDGLLLLRSLLSADSGFALGLLTPLLLAAAFLAKYRHRAEDERWLTIATAIVFSTGICLTVVFGFGEQISGVVTTPTFVLYTLFCFIAAIGLHRPSFLWGGSCLLLLALGQGLAYDFHSAINIPLPWAMSLLVHGLACTLAASLLPRWPIRHAARQAVLHYSAVLTTGLAGLVVLLAKVELSWLSVAGYVALATVNWGVLAWRMKQTWLLFTFQHSLAWVAFCLVTSWAASHEWYQERSLPWLDPRFLQLQGLALVGLGMMWQLFRYATAQWPPAEIAAKSEHPTNASRWCETFGSMLHRQLLGFDQIGQVLSVCLAVALAYYAAIPGAAQELSTQAIAGWEGRAVAPPEVFAISDVSHVHAAAIGAWILLLGVVFMLLLQARLSKSKIATLTLLLVASAFCPLVAARWHADVAVASALRWSMAAFFATVSLPLIFRDKFLPYLHGFGLPAGQAIRGLLLGITFAPYVLMGIFVATSALDHGHPALDLGQYGVISATLVVVGMLVLPFAGNRIHLPGLSSLSRERPSQGSLMFGGLIALLVIGPVLIAGLFEIAQAIASHPIVGPNARTFFRNAGWSVSYGVPLAVIAIALLGHAVRERSPSYAAAAAALTNLLANVVYLLNLSRRGESLDSSSWLEIAHLNSIVCALIAIVWASSQRWYLRREGETHVFAWPFPLTFNGIVAVSLAVIPLGIGVLGVVVEPQLLPWMAGFGSPIHWTAFVLALAMVGTTSWNRNANLAFSAGLLGILSIGMATLTVARFDDGNWLAYHTLHLSVMVMSWVMLAIPARWFPPASRDLHRIDWSSLLNVVVVTLALRALVGDPTGSNWSLFALASATALSMTLAWRTAQNLFVWKSTVVACLASLLWWVDYGSSWLGEASVFASHSCLHLMVIVAGLFCAFSVSIQRRRMSLVAEVDALQMSFHPIGFWAGLFAISSTLVGRLADDASGSVSVSAPLLGWAIAAMAFATVTALWDEVSRRPVASLYCFGLLLAGGFLDALDASYIHFYWCAALTSSGWVLLSSFVWCQRTRLISLAGRWHVPIVEKAALASSPEQQAASNFLAIGNGIQAALITVVVLWLNLNLEPTEQRIAASLGILALAGGFFLLANERTGSTLRYLTLSLGALFAIAFGWAWLPLDIQSPLLHRAAATLAALVSIVPLYSFGLLNFAMPEGDWARTVRKMVPPLGGMAAGLVLLILAAEFGQFLTLGQVIIQGPAVGIVAFALLSITCGLLMWALIPGRDPFGFSTQSRSAYVYAAEVSLALLFVHIRLTMPWMFGGWFVRIWPLVVVAISFIGVGVSHWMRRRQHLVLSDPLQNTAAILPLLPVLGFWLMPSSVNFSLVLLSIGSLYATLSVLRKSVFFAAAAALACNSSLWYLLHSTTGLGLLQHPQMWLIPPAVSLLVAVHLNRDRLTDSQVAAARYLSTLAIYVSSTTDVFINGVGADPWLPIVLGGLAIAGIFAGIWLRIRAFLFLGLSFLLVDLLTVVWHAAVELEMTWIWWVTGIVTGVLIIALFGLFEKKRDEMLALAHRMKHWDA